MHQTMLKLHNQYWTVPLTHPHKNKPLNVVQCALCYLWHSGCGRVAWYSMRQSSVQYCMVCYQCQSSGGYISSSEGVNDTYLWPHDIDVRPHLKKNITTWILALITHHTIRQLNHTPSSMKNIRRFVPTLSNTYRKDVNKVRMLINSSLTINGHGT